MLTSEFEGDVSILSCEKHGRGFSHPIAHRFLCPIDRDLSNPK